MSRPGIPEAAATSEATSPATVAGGLPRLEVAILAGILGCGIALRVAFPAGLAVEHFDEGVYASNVWFEAATGGQYPARHLYAPALVPALIEGSLLAEQMVTGFGRRPTGLAAVMPSLAAGCLTLVIVWWVMRTWFGAAAAIGATTLAALSEFHALYSRAALTDVVLLPWMLLAVFLFERAVATRQLRLLVMAGVACGLAWWTKYNGWLPLLIAASGLAGRAVFVPAARRSLGRDVGYWVGFATLAALVWSPYLWSLQTTGGYTPVMENHRGYVVGWTGWPTSLTNQLANLSHFEGWLSCLAPAAALGLGLVLIRFDPVRAAPPAADKRQADWFLAGTLAATMIAVAGWCGQAAVLSFLSVAGLLALGQRQRSRADDASQEGASTGGGLALWLVAAWFAGLFVATPLYSPYPRLTLTWLCASWLASGLGLATLGRDCRYDSDHPISTRLRGRGGRIALAVMLLAAVAATLLASQRVTARGVPPWQDRAGLRRIATEIEQHIDAQSAIVYVQGEPGLYYQLRAAGLAAAPGFDVTRLPDSTSAGVTTYLATGLHAQRSADFQRQLAQIAPRLEEIAALPYQPSDLVLLNNYRVNQLGAARQAAWRVMLYRVK